MPQAVPGLKFRGERRDQHVLPAGAELMIALALGAFGWWVIVRTVLWFIG